MRVTNNAVNVVAAFDTFVVLGSMEVKVGATADVGTLSKTMQPSEISCNLHVAAPATCMVLQAFTGNPACRLSRLYPSNGSRITPTVLNRLKSNPTSILTCKSLAPLSPSRSKTTCVCSITNLQASPHWSLRWLCASRATKLLQPSGGNLPLKS